ncbi:MAG TPA: PilZ domain-containing protein [Nitrospira sp.]|nr:PilZ domain-containing protein [Nitrospira sp.]
MTHQRRLYRVAIDRTGQVRRGLQAYPCHVIDLTEHGVRLQVDGTFSTGDELQLEFTLTDVDALACTIQVTNLRPPYLGAAIIQIASDQQKRLASFIEQVNALNMTGL